MPSISSSSPPPPPPPPSLFFTMSDHSPSSLFDSAAVNHPPPPPPPPVQDSVIDSLISAEHHYSPTIPDYLLRSNHRQDSINWILNAHQYYRFHPLTAVLSVNYFDRFLSATPSFEFHDGWEFQLLSVACLSLAAKMEEPEVPLPLDLQVSEPRFVFEPKTIHRMELWVMEKLDWRLRSVTPFDFMDYFIFKLPHSFRTNEHRFHRICSDLIVQTIRVIEFLGFRPSVIAAAAVISAAGEGVEIPESYYEKVNKEMVRTCHQLMTCRSADEPPRSPNGVLDAATCVSSDTGSDNTDTT